MTWQVSEGLWPDTGWTTAGRADRGGSGLDAGKVARGCYDWEVQAGGTDKEVRKEIKEHQRLHHYDSNSDFTIRLKACSIYREWAFCLINREANSCNIALCRNHQTAQSWCWGLEVTAEWGGMSTYALRLWEPLDTQLTEEDKEMPPPKRLPFSTKTLSRKTFLKLSPIPFYISQILITINK